MRETPQQLLWQLAPPEQIRDKRMGPGGTRQRDHRHRRNLALRSPKINQRPGSLNEVKLISVRFGNFRNCRAISDRFEKAFEVNHKFGDSCIDSVVHQIDGKLKSRRG